MTTTIPRRIWTPYAEPERCRRCGGIVRHPRFAPTLPRRYAPRWRRAPLWRNMAGNAIQVGTSDGAIRVKDNGIVVAGDTDECCCEDSVTHCAFNECNSPSVTTSSITVTFAGCALISDTCDVAVDSGFVISGSFDLPCITTTGKLQFAQSYPGSYGTGYEMAGCTGASAPLTHLLVRFINTGSIFSTTAKLEARLNDRDVLDPLAGPVVYSANCFFNGFVSHGGNCVNTISGITPSGSPPAGTINTGGTASIAWTA